MEGVRRGLNLESLFRILRKGEIWIAYLAGVTVRRRRRRPLHNEIMLWLALSAGALQQSTFRPPLGTPLRSPAVHALLSPSATPSSSAVRRTAKGRRTEIDGSPAGEGGAAAAVLREARARALPRPPAAVVEIIDDAFYGTYDAVEINALWDQVKSCYGNELAAIEAVKRQPYIINPTYTWPPPLLTRSKDALVEVLGSEDEALEVMLKNPAGAHGSPAHLCNNSSFAVKHRPASFQWRLPRCVLLAQCCSAARPASSTSEATRSSSSPTYATSEVRCRRG